MVFRQSRAKPTAPFGGLLNKISIAEAAFHERALVVNGLYALAALLIISAVAIPAAPPYFASIAILAVIWARYPGLRRKRIEQALIEWDEERLTLTRHVAPAETIAWNEVAAVQFEDSFSWARPSAQVKLFDSTGAERLNIPFNWLNRSQQTMLWAGIVLMTLDPGQYPRGGKIHPLPPYIARWTFAVFAACYALALIRPAFTDDKVGFPIFLPTLLLVVLQSEYPGFWPEWLGRWKLRRAADEAVLRLKLEAEAWKTQELPPFGRAFTVDNVNAVESWVLQARTRSLGLLLLGLTCLTGGIYAQSTQNESGYRWIFVTTIGAILSVAALAALGWQRPKSIIPGRIYRRSAAWDGFEFIDNGKWKREGGPISASLLQHKVIAAQIRRVDFPELAPTPATPVAETAPERL